MQPTTPDDVAFWPSLFVCPPVITTTSDDMQHPHVGNLRPYSSFVELIYFSCLFKEYRAYESTRQIKSRRHEIQQFFSYAINCLFKF